jgi:hypothetical protein
MINKPYKKQSWIFVTGLIVLLYAAQISAFYQFQGENTSVDARGLIRAFTSAYQYPDDTELYTDKNSAGLAGVARLVIDGYFSENLGFEFNIYQSYIPRDLTKSQGNAGLPLGLERSNILEKNFANSDYAHLAIDRLALRYSNQSVDLTIGRQAINLATTFYFTPNDFFAPFAAQSFFRVYKSGVDALRAEVSLGELSQLSLISVLGYKTDISNDTGWSNSPDKERTSYLMRWSNAYGNIDATLILGHIIDKNIIGLALQGELHDWLGIRLEGHHGFLDNSDSYQQLSIGLEHRWENTLELRLEFFYNGLGSKNIPDYQITPNTNNGFYLARHYSALGGSYEITPLLIAEAVMLSNFNDQSQLLSLNSVYSLSDESEMVINLILPFGNEPEDGLLKSEFGAYPRSINIEFRSYF